MKKNFSLYVIENSNLKDAKAEYQNNFKAKELKEAINLVLDAQSDYVKENANSIISEDIAYITWDSLSGQKHQFLIKEEHFEKEVGSTIAIFEAKKDNLND